MSSTTASREPLKIGVTFHSFTNEFISYVWAFEDLMVNATQLGGGVEIVGPVHHRRFPEVPDEFITAFRNSVERNDLTPTCYGSYADPFVLWERNLTDAELIEYTIPQIVGAARLGFPIVRLQHFAASIAEQVLPLAERLDVKLAYELHAPLDLESARTQELLEQIRRVDSPFLGLIPDAGIFARTISPVHQEHGLEAGLSEADRDEIVRMWDAARPLEDAEALIAQLGVGREAQEWASHIWGSHGRSDPANLRDIAEYIVHVHAKFYSLDAEGEEPALRHGDLVRALLDIDYQGWISSEYEGPPADSFALLVAQQRMMRRHERDHLGIGSQA